MEFNNVRIVKAANVYFDGKVTSRTIYLSNGEKKTLGFMSAGEYKFNTSVEELMELLGGDMDICLLGETEYTHYETGESFIVPSNSSFQLIVKKYADYCCSYKDL